MQNENEKQSFGEMINNFSQKNRKGLIIFSSAIFIILAGLIVFLSLQDVFNKKAIAKVEEINVRFQELRYFTNDINYTAEIQTLLSDIEAFAKNKSGYAAGKAWSMAAQIYSSRNEWQKAEETWLKAAKAGDKTYLGPISLFNAAAAAEEQGKIELAIELLQKSIDHKFEFPAAPRAQFSIGRLYEQLGNYPAAIESYRTVMINWQNVPVWQYLARSRIIAIE
ncbi:MAG: tetratricopeptide repeat protein [Spirochaetes bacterium]|nr:tetratricopeptide repeat protein [Brevinematales bacterium]MCL1960166.1 tetratricopeptide repeat protein [Spirochaetota bacterium]